MVESVRCAEEAHAAAQEETLSDLSRQDTQTETRKLSE